MPINNILKVIGRLLKLGGVILFIVILVELTGPGTTETFSWAYPVSVGLFFSARLLETIRVKIYDPVDEILGLPAWGVNLALTIMWLVILIYALT